MRVCASKRFPVVKGESRDLVLHLHHEGASREMGHGWMSGEQRTCSEM